MSISQPLPSSQASPPSSIDRLRLDELSDAELDVLPFGVIGLEADGRVARYNLAEARFARLDRALVLGRNFWVDIAPCTATDEFKGRVERFRQSNDRNLRFDYVFDFRFGAQLVTIEVVRGDRPDLVLLCVNRKSQISPRSEISPAMLAADQSDLAPDEASYGVQRDEAQRRQLVLSPMLFEGLAYSLRKRSEPERARLFHEWGIAWGRRAVIELEAGTLLERDNPLSELSVAEAIERVAVELERQGWGRLWADFALARSGAFLLHVERGALAEVMRAGKGPRCQLLAGYLEAMFSHLAGRRVHAREACCVAAGAPTCAFALVAPARLDALESAIESSEGDASKLAVRWRSLS